LHIVILTFAGLLYQPAKPLPPNYIPRVQLLKDITKAVLKFETDNTVGTTVTLLGWAGFGKTTLAKGLCHQKKIEQHFMMASCGYHLANTHKVLK